MLVDRKNKSKMGKTKKIKSVPVTKVPLEQDIQNSRIAKSKNRNKIRLRQDEEEQVFLNIFLTLQHYT